MTASVVLRAAGPADAEWLYELHACALRAAVEQTYGPWDDGYQRSRFFEHLGSDDVYVISWQNVPVGALYLDDRDAQVFLSLVEIWPEHQRKGLGSMAIRWVIDHADRDGRPVWLQVLKTNSAARRLYERMGFDVVDQTSTHHVMRRATSAAERSRTRVR